MEIGFVHPWRPQQVSALAAFAASQAESDHNHYLITPLGAGKSHVGGLRLDAEWPSKVANTWTITTVANGHPKGTGDYARFVAKHDGFFAVDDDGQITSDVSHVDPALSPYAPPKPSEFDVINSRMRGRALNRERARCLWAIGEPYADAAGQVVQVRTGRSLGLTGRTLDAVLPPRRTAQSASRFPLWVSGSVAVPAWIVAEFIAASNAAVAASSALAGYAVARTAMSVKAVLRPAGSTGLHDIAAAVADALHHAGLIPLGAEAVAVIGHADGSYLAMLRE